MGGQYEVKDGVTKKYYSIAGMMVATHDGTALQYLLTDHLGSTVAVTNSSGTLTSQQRYLPFGEARTIPNSPILATDFGYTGQRLLDPGMGGIMDYKARFYSPALGRFVQPDSMIPNPTNPQSWNRFGYVLNNPMRFNDPTGHVCSDPEDPNPTCDGSFMQTTKVGDKMVRGSGLNAGRHKAKTKNKNDLIHWDDDYLPIGLSEEDILAAENAYLHALEDPEYFYNLYFNSDYSAWENSAEVRYLDIYLQYSILGTNANSYILSLYGIDATSGSVIRAIGADDPQGAMDYADGLGFAAIVIAGYGHSGRFIPNNVTEQTAMDYAMKNAYTGNVLNMNMQDPRWPVEDGWIKMEQRYGGVKVHYLFNPNLNMFDDFKFPR